MDSAFPARLNPSVDRFEDAWAAGPPRLADFLPPAGDPDRPVVLAELIRVDLDRRATRNEFPDPHALYADLLPELAAHTVAGLERYAAAVRDRHRPDAPADPLPVVEGYDVHEELGRGGMGVVYRATHRALNREVALKLLPGGTPEATRRFEREAEAAAAVRHPHAVVVYDFGRAGGRPYLAMELCPGGTLEHRLKASGGRQPPDGSVSATGGRQPPGPPQSLAPREAAELLAKVARGVAAVHDREVVHRDLKPGNILFDAAGGPKVADFGLAKVGRSDATDTGAVMGTLPYMAPEQVAGGAKFLTPAADVWALGAILYECLTGSRPFGGGDTWAVIDRIGHADPPGVRRGCPGCPRDLEAVVLKCLAKPPHRRYPTAAELADDLDRFLAGEAVTARRPSAAGRAARWARRRPAAALAVALGVVIVVGLAVATALLTDAYGNEKAARDQADRDRDTARLREQEAITAKTVADDERQRADERKKEAESVSDLLVGLFGASDPIGVFLGGGDLGGPIGPETTARELLLAGLPKLRARTDLPDAARATLLTTLGGAYRSLGELDTARSCLTEALTTRRRLHPGDHPDTAATLAELGWLAIYQGDFADGVAHQREALAMRQRVLPPDDPAITRELIRTAFLSSFNLDEHAHDRHGRAAVMLRTALDRQNRFQDSAHGDPVMTRLLLAGLLYGIGFPELVAEANGLVDEADKIAGSDQRRRWAIDAVGQVVVSQLQFRLGYPDRMARHMAQAVGLLKRHLGPDHPLVGAAYISLTEALVRAGRIDGAEAAYAEARRILDRLLPAGHFVLALLRTGAGNLLRDMAGDRPDAPRHRELAVREYRAAMDMAARVGRPDLFNKARQEVDPLLRKMGRAAEADDLLRRPEPIPRPRPKS